MRLRLPKLRLSKLKFDPRGLLAGLATMPRPAFALPRPGRTFKMTALLLLIVLLTGGAIAAALLAEPVFAVGRDGARNDFPPTAALVPGSSGLLHRLASDLVGSSGQAHYRALIGEFERSLPLPSGARSAAKRQRALADLASAAEDHHLPPNERSQLADDWGLEEIMLLTITPQSKQSEVIAAAAKALQLAVNLDPSNETAKFNLELLWRLSQPQKPPSTQKQQQGGHKAQPKTKASRAGSMPQGYSW